MLYGRYRNVRNEYGQNRPVPTIFLSANNAASCMTGISAQQCLIGYGWLELQCSRG
jgi:hypothetical protein